jgi:hypothetical protein
MNSLLTTLASQLGEKKKGIKRGREKDEKKT